MSSKIETHNHLSTLKPQPLQRTTSESGALEVDILSQSVVQQARRNPTLLTPRDVLHLQNTTGNRFVVGLLGEVNQRPSSTLDGAVQRVIELPEIQIVGDPHFYNRAQRRNQHWAANPPQPGWPYDERLRELWNQGAYDEFADMVREYQSNVMGNAFESSDGILGPQTATALNARPLPTNREERELGREDEAATSEPTEPGMAPLDPNEAEIREVPEWLMAYATDTNTPWPIHSAAYAEAMASGGIGIEGVAETWEGFLNQMGEMTFLGHPFVGHTAFLRKLDIAQRYLRSNHPDIERHPGVGFNVPGTRSQWRAAERLTASPHIFGMAIDFGAEYNPWMSNPDEPDRNTMYAWIMWRATWLMSRGTPVTPAESHRRAGSRSSASNHGTPQSTEEIWEYIDDANQATLAYLNLVGNRNAVEQRLRLLGTPPPPPGPAVVRRRTVIGEYVPENIPADRLGQGVSSIDDWMHVIEHDRLNWPNRTQQQQGQNQLDDPIRGIMNLKRELVIALRDHGGLQWGACDLGESQSGDMMHFALDPPRFFRFRENVRQALQAARNTMSSREYRNQQRTETTRRNEMARRGSREYR